VVLVEGLGNQRLARKVDAEDHTEVCIHDLLPRHVSSARILSFTYNPPTDNDRDSASLFSVEALTGAAEALLRTLEQRRKTDKETEAST
jgi:hypothetical protein